MKKKLVVITGPTGSGKTALAIRVARELGTEIVSADSRQVFREMRIGTAAPDARELAEVKHHLIGHISVMQEYNAALYASEAKACIEDLFIGHHTVVVCGGSGLYIRALLNGMDQMPDIPELIRNQVQEDFRQKGLEWLQNEAERIDPEWYATADPQNHRRLIRCIEVFRAAGQKLSALQTGKKSDNNWNVIKISTNLPVDLLYRRINDRVDQMVSDGLFEEAESLYGLRDLKALNTVGYREVFSHMDGKYSREETISLIRQHTRNYAKRQMTWFRKESDLIYLTHTGEGSELSEIMERINSF